MDTLYPQKLIHKKGFTLIIQSKLSEDFFGFELNNSSQMTFESPELAIDVAKLFEALLTSEINNGGIYISPQVENQISGQYEQSASNYYSENIKNIVLEKINEFNVLNNYLKHKFYTNNDDIYDWFLQTFNQLIGFPTAHEQGYDTTFSWEINDLKITHSPDDIFVDIVWNIY